VDENGHVSRLYPAGTMPWVGARLRQGGAVDSDQPKRMIATQNPLLVFLNG